MHDRLTVSRVVSKLPVKLSGIVVTPSGNDKYAVVMVYDGESTQDPAVVSIRSGAGTSRQVIFSPPLRLDRGLYVSIAGDCEGVLVTYDY